MSDYKYAAQMIAEQLAEDAGLDYFKLSTEEQCALYERGMREYVDRQMNAADLMEDR